MKKIILLSSVLKPVTEPRMYEKIGKTLRSVAQYDVHIFGTLRNQELFLEDLKVHEHSFYTRSFYFRIKILLQYFKLLFRLKPQLLVPSTLDLLLISYFYKFFNAKTSIIYDMRENFSFNTRNHQHYSGFISFLISKSEKLLIKLSNGLIYAEKVYLNQLNEVENSILMENFPTKVEENGSFNSKSNKNLNFLYSGNLTQEYGIYEVLIFYKKIKKWFPNAHLTIIGNCLDKNVLKDLSLFSIAHLEVKLIGIEKAASHEQILAEIKKANFGLVSYQKNKAFDGKYPTKVYEYLQAKLPMLLFEDQTWNELVLKYDAGILCKVQDLTKGKMQYILEKQYFQIDRDTSKFTWENQESRLLEFFYKF